MPYDVLIRGGDRDIAIADGAIAGFEAGPAREEIDARGLTVLPGVIDAHVHFNEPGRTDWEGWATGTHALAAGGATACVEMPLNAHPPTIDGPAFDAKVAAARASAVVDFALWGGLVPGNLGRLEELAERGVVGFKAFMCDSGIADFPAVDEDVLGAGMARAAELGLPVAVHAEDPATLRTPTGTGWRDFVASRPIEAELRAIETAIELARETGCSLHVVHVSTARGVDLVTQSDATCETCPHYLVLTEDDLETFGTRAKCAPPLRPAAERDALRERIGDLAFIASDHSPCPPDMKAGEFTAAWGGIAGCQTLLPLLLDLGVDDVVKLTSTGPAERLRLPKGGITPGADADLVLVDLDDRHAPELLDRHRLSPFAGRPLRGRVVRTLVRGTTVFHDGRIVAEPHGRLLTPTKGDPA
ncbi:MAG TPA: allantoinase AllB [Solirubrobacteraceae bacterium]|nr:allantoinase AllB [Solirubrobacteraceae bacterium]